MAESCVAASADLFRSVVCVVCTAWVGSTLSSDMDRWSVAALEVDIARSEVGDDAVLLICIAISFILLVGLSSLSTQAGRSLVLVRVGKVRAMRCGNSGCLRPMPAAASGVRLP